MGKTLYIIAGCNGAGKTTAAYTLLPEMYKCKEFVNSDEIARGLSPFKPEAVSVQAGKIMLNRIDELLKGNKSFAVETTLSTRYYLSIIRKAHDNGFKVFLLFFWLRLPEIAIKRVAQRVAEGGHSVPVSIIKRRYYSGINNFFKLYINQVDYWSIIDNTMQPRIIIATGNNDQLCTLYHPDLFNQIKSHVGERNVKTDK